MIISSHELLSFSPDSLHYPIKRNRRYSIAEEASSRECIHKAYINSPFNKARLSVCGSQCATHVEGEKKISEELDHLSMQSFCSIIALSQGSWDQPQTIGLHPHFDLRLNKLH